MTTSLLWTPGLFSVLLPIFYHAVVLMVSILLIFSSSISFSKPPETVPSAATTIGITVILIIDSFLVFWQGPGICQSFRSLSFSLCIIIIIIYSFRVFHISVSWWSFTGFWVTASLLRSPGLFSVFWPFLIM